MKVTSVNGIRQSSGCGEGKANRVMIPLRIVRIGSRGGGHRPRQALGRRHGQQVLRLTPACFKSLAAPDARSVAGGLQVRLWLFNPMLDGRRLDGEGLKDPLFAYLEAAQARATLEKLFPTVQRFSNVSTS